MPKEYVKQIIGALIGVAIALLFLFLGFWKGLLVAALALAGWWLCGERKLPAWLVELIDRIRTPKDHM